MNDIIRRTLKFNDEGNLIKDYIFMFNPLFSDREVKYSALVLPNIPIFDYLIEDKRLFKNDRGAFINDILPDLLIEDYINYNDYYGTILDAFSNNPEKVMEIVSNLEDFDLFGKYVEESFKVLSKTK